MIQKRIGNTLKLIYNLTLDGQPSSAAGRDFDIFVYEKKHCDERIKLPVIIEGDKVTAMFEGKYQKRVGTYVAELYENFRENNQAVLDQIAFELVCHSADESDEQEGDYLEIQTVNLTAELVTGILGPKGDKGDKGDQGEPGPQGPKGEDADIEAAEAATQYAIDVATAAAEAEEQRVVDHNKRGEEIREALEFMVKCIEDTQAITEETKESAQAAKDAAAGAIKVNAQLSGTNLTVTDRNGVSVTSNVQGPAGKDGVDGGMLFPDITYDVASGCLTIEGNGAERFEYDEETGTLTITF